MPTSIVVAAAVGEKDINFTCGEGVNNEKKADNAAFIAAARTDVTELLDEVERLASDELLTATTLRAEKAEAERDEARSLLTTVDQELRGALVWAGSQWGQKNSVMWAVDGAKRAIAERDALLLEMGRLLGALATSRREALEECARYFERGGRPYIDQDEWNGGTAATAIRTFASKEKPPKLTIEDVKEALKPNPAEARAVDDYIRKTFTEPGALAGKKAP